jgi:hypothetical protein
MGMAQPPSPEEKSGLNKVMWFGIIQIVSLVAGWVVSFLVFGTIFASTANLNLPQNPTPQQVSTALGPLFQSFAYLIPALILIGIVGTVMLMLGFRDLAKVDGSRFSLPWKLTLILIIGVAIVAAGVVTLFDDIPNIIAQAPTGSGTPSAAFAAAISTILVAALVAFLGGILALIGVIGGEILGLWRVGSRYNESIFKIGAIFLIIPLLNIVAPILILVGAYQVKGRLDRPM